MFLKSILIIAAIALVGGYIYYKLKPYGEIINASLSDSYYFSTDGKGVNYSPMGNWFELGNTRFDADVKSFEVIAHHFARDKDHVYYMYATIDQYVDHSTFRFENQYPRDRDHVYIAGFPYDEKIMLVIEGADPNTYRNLDYGYGWARDKDHYYYQNKKLNVDGATFEMVNKSFFKDKHWVYYADWDSLRTTSYSSVGFTKLNDHYAYDNENLYYNSYVDRNPLKDENNMSIEVISKSKEPPIALNDFFVKVDGRIFYKGFELKEAKAGSFVALSAYVGKDDQRVFYEMTSLIDADPLTFVFLDGLFARDAHHVYWDGKLLKGADPGSFQITGHATGEDNNYKYSREDRVKK